MFFDPGILEQVVVLNSVLGLVAKRKLLKIDHLDKPEKKDSKIGSLNGKLNVLLGIQAN